jgi:hypothetical protein
MERLIAGPLAAALEAGRPRFNALFAQARHQAPALDATAFAEHLRTTVAPVVDEVARVAPDRVGTVVEVLFELSLDLFGKDLPSRCPALAEGWGKLLLGLPRHLAEAPRRLAGSITNALYNLAQVAGVRPGEWTDILLRLGGHCPDVGTLLEVGKVAGWRAGLAHFRDGALEACRRLPPALARAALGLPAGPGEIEPIVRRLQADPWLHPAKCIGSPAGEGQLRIVARVGAFRGFGGLFLWPPGAAVVDGQLLVTDGTACWALTADVFGATLHPAGATLPKEAKSSAGGFRLDARGTVSRDGQRQVFDDLRDSTSCAATATTLAVTVPLAHAVYLVANQL